MPLLHYFGFVGAVLLSLLFVADFYLPRPLERSEPARSYSIRIASEKKGPEAVTFAGHAVDYGRPREHASLIAEASGYSRLASRASTNVPVKFVTTAKKKVAKRKLRPVRNYNEFAQFPRWHESFASHQRSCRVGNLLTRSGGFSSSAILRSSRR